MKPNTHLSIPPIVYDTLRAIHESRAHRADTASIVRYVSNSEIFNFMPDHKQINWARDDQMNIIAETLLNMEATVEWSQ